MSSEGSVRIDDPIEEKRRRAALLLARKGGLLRAGASAPVWPAMSADECGDVEFELTATQRRLWFMQQLHPDSTAYHISFVLHFDGRVDFERLALAWRQLCRRHPALTTRFVGDPDAPRQRFDGDAPPLRHLMHSGDRESLIAHLCESSAQLFDLMDGPPLRVSLCDTATGQQSLWLSCHHIVLDGRSVQLLIDALSSAYMHPERSPAGAAPTFARAVVWLRDVEADAPARAASQGYWERLHQNPPSALVLPAPIRPAQAPAETHFFAWTGESLQTLRALARDCEATSAATLLALYSLLLSRCSNTTQCAIGMPLDGRPLAELGDVCGFLANTVALRCVWQPEQSFREYVRASAKALIDAERHQFHSLDGLVHTLGLTGSGDAPPLFQAMLAYQRRQQAIDTFADLGCRMQSLPAARAKFDLTLLLDDDGDRIEGRLELDATRIDIGFAATLPARLESLLHQARAEPDRALSSMDILLRDEHALLQRNVRNEAEPAADVLTRIERIVRERPEAIALSDVNGDLDYAGLWAVAGRIAAAIPVDANNGRARVLAVVADDARGQLLGVLSALLCGCAYLPVSMKLPAQRQVDILRDAAPVAVLVDDAIGFGSDAVLQIPRIAFSSFPDEAPADSRPFVAAAHGEHGPAYVIYTSGSTGRPKGVLLPRRTLNRLIDWQLAALAEHPPRLVGQYSNFSFDVSLQEMLVSLCAGACYVALQDPQRYDFDWLSARLQTHRIDTLFMPTAVAMLFLEHLSQTRIPLPDVRHLMVAGEALRLGQAHCEGWSLLPNAQLWNQYGPSETHVVSAERIARPQRGMEPRITIGTAIDGSELWVLDQQMRPLPPGCVGELYLGGDGLADGYLRQASQTASRFVPHPFAAHGARAYRTGDLARLCEDGRVEFIGRADHQVKVRGHRVELGEIEQVLLAQPGVRHARVLVHGGGSHANLIGYVAASPTVASDLKAALAMRLPHYMVPAAIVCVEHWPITANGKVDTRALPDPAEALAAANKYEPPRDARERALAEIWEELLGGERIGRRYDFFERGGHSLLATRMIGRLRAQHGWRVALTDVFATPCLADLAQKLVQDVVDVDPQAAWTGNDGPLSFSQRRLWFLEKLGSGTVAYHEQRAYRLCGEVDVAALRTAIGAVMARHDALRTGFEEYDGEPRQRIVPDVDDPLLLEDLRADPDPVAAAQALLEWAGRQAFDLGRPPLMRVQLLRLGADEWWLAFTVHHIVIDGWSMGLITRELSDFYARARAGEQISADATALRFLDVARQEHEKTLSADFQARVRDYATRLAGVPPLLDLPTDRPRTNARSTEAGVVPLVLPAALDAQLRAYCRRQRTTPYMMLMAAYCATLHRYTGQPDLCVGTAMANRDDARTEEVVGFFVNTVAVCSRMPEGERVEACLARIRDAVLDVFSSGDVPFEAVVEQLRPERHLGYTPVVQVMFNLQNTGEEMLRLGVQQIEELPYCSQATKFDLTLSLRDCGDRFVGGFEFALDLFDSATIERLAGLFEHMLAGLLGPPDREVMALPWLSQEERWRLLQLSGRSSGYPREENVVSVFRAQVARTPDAVALC
ncbi:non-ribosomal peptide synthetase, partial [Burkholderia sp.]|uniref:non-ribosomal peptide synthetase n=1 Tax=Burkholderia sp. TaxID=36773 RepID=UPI00258C52A1